MLAGGLATGAVGTGPSYQWPRIAGPAGAVPRAPDTWAPPDPPALYQTTW